MTKTTTRGFTMVEIMVVIAIIGLLATIGVPAWVRAIHMARNTRFLNDSRKFADGVEIFATEKNYYPATADPGDIPAGLEPYIDAEKWYLMSQPGSGSSIGGWWDIDVNETGGVGCALGVVTAGGRAIADDAQLQLLDNRDDDGDLAAGALRRIGNGYYLVISEEAVLESP